MLELFNQYYQFKKKIIGDLLFVQSVVWRKTFFNGTGTLTINKHPINDEQLFSQEIVILFVEMGLYTN